MAYDSAQQYEQRPGQHHEVGCYDSLDYGLEESSPYDLERSYRESRAMRGLRDIEVAGAVTILGSFAQIIHDQAPGELSHVADPNILERLAALPIDYKAVVALAAAYAVKSGVARMVHAERLNEDMATGQTAGLFGRERLAIVDANERRGQHWRQRLGRGAAFAVSGFLAYKGTEHASTEHIMNASLGSLAMGMAGAHYARYRAKQFLKRQKEASAAPCRRRASDRHR